MKNIVDITGAVIDYDVRFLTSGVQILYIYLNVNNGDNTFSKVLIRIEENFINKILKVIKKKQLIKIKGILSNYYYHDKLRKEVYDYCINAYSLSIIFNNKKEVV